MYLACETEARRKQPLSLTGMDQSGAPPPVPHTLRPHHAGVLLMLIVYYRGVDYQDGDESTNSVSHTRWKDRFWPNVMRSPEVLGDLFSADFEVFRSDARNLVAGVEDLPALFPELQEAIVCRPGLQIYPVIFDLHELSKSDQFEQFEASQKTGDSKGALDSLRRFYDQRFALSDDSVLYQHSLLSMAELHYNQGEHRAARHFDAAISPDPGTLFIARDRTSTVKAGIRCLVLYFSPRTHAGAHRQGEGLQLAFIKVTESMGVWDAKLRSNLGLEKWPKHAVLAVLWKLAGIETLAKCHENIIRAFTQAGDDDSRMAAICSQASRTRLSKQSPTTSSRPSNLARTQFLQYSLWAHEVWNVFSFTMARKGQKALHREFLLPNQPPAPPVTQSLGASSPYQSKTVITESLRLAMQYKDASQTVAAIKPLMEAIWSAEFRGMYSYYRIAVVLLADVGLELGLAHSGRALIEEVLPQLLLGDDLELRAYASLTYARCILAGAGADVSETKLKECRPHLIRAIKDYKVISKYEKALEVLYTFSVVCHNLRTFGERDSWASQFITLDEERKAAGRMGVTEETREVFKTITEVAYVVGQEQ
ncbi:hypothetical protein BS47DRAFT_1357008 [Hydnum rufescens UP504]|uniref:Anaphase-promoting complex subunit 5 n=1 Tax=Hydnum rufescens UP504 TaxID=1448309 RepID=A0A9P6BBI5_9AGAM|nr:hypothetical protein BS47DRAFT_1357008 [Hydnum rufescens UP504]